ncbi:hypothetical protein Bca101_010138 [Brassica carinata]
MAVEKYGPHFPTTLDEHFGTSRYTPEVKGMIEVLRQNNPQWSHFDLAWVMAAYALPPGQNRAPPLELVIPNRPSRIRKSQRNKVDESSSEDVEASPESVAEAKKPVPRGRVLRSMSNVQSPGIDARPLTIALPSGEKREAPTSSAKSIDGDLQGSEASSAAHKSKRRRLSIIPSASSSPSDQEVPSSVKRPGGDPLRASEGRDKVPPPLSFSYDKDIPIFEDPENLALVWRKIRAKDCDLLGLDKMSERGAYIRMATANAKNSLGARIDYLERSHEDEAAKEVARAVRKVIMKYRGRLERVKAYLSDQEEGIPIPREKLKLHEAGLREYTRLLDKIDVSALDDEDLVLSPLPSPSRD